MLNNTKKITGGMFGWKEYNIKGIHNYSFLNNSNIFVFNGRSAIFSIITTLKPQTVWLPDYLCETIIDAVNKTETKIRYFKINEQLEIENTDWINNVEANDIVFFIEYFGFPVDNKIVKQIKLQDGIIVIDAAQALLSKNNRELADFVIFSPRKTIEIPNGAVIETKNKSFLKNIKLQKPDTKSLFYIFKAYQKRTLFDNGNKNDWFEDYKISEKNQLVGNYRIDDFSLSFLKNSIDYKNIETKRRENFRFLLKELTKVSIFKELPNEVIPLAFPILTGKREQILEQLYKNNIFAPIHWPVTYKNRPFNKILKVNEISLICDQRISVKSLEKTINIIKKLI